MSEPITEATQGAVMRIRAKFKVLASRSGLKFESSWMNSVKSS